MNQKKLFLLFYILILLIDLSAQSSTLSYFSENLLNNYNSSDSSNIQVCRFELDQPYTLKKVKVYLGGERGNFVMHLIGHEGGSAFPHLFIDKYPTVIGRKNTDGLEVVELEIPDGTLFENDQIYILFDNFTSNLGLQYHDSTDQQPCEDSGGSKFGYFYFGNDYSDLNQGGIPGIELELQTQINENTFYFNDVTHQLGIDTTLSNQSISIGDLNNDGFEDLLLAGHLYLNSIDSFIDVTSDLGLGNKTMRFRANMFLDHNNDGKLDIIKLGARYSVLWIQEDSMNFSKHKLKGIPPLDKPTGYSIADINNDKLPDLFICQLWRTYPKPLPNFLLLNDGNLDFIDQTQCIYPQHDSIFNFSNNIICDPKNNDTWKISGNKNRRSRGAQFVDFDNDGDLDLYISNYFLEQDELHENVGDGVFKNITNDKGIDQNRNGHNHGTGVDWYDYDNDGDQDLLLSQFAHPAFVKKFDHRGTTIYENSGPPNYLFTDKRNSHGIQYEETHAGSSWGDFNNDGLVDFAVMVYYGCRYADLYQQKSDNSFALKTYEAGLSKISADMDANWFDFNNDGKLDLLMGEKKKLRLFKNVIDNDAHYVFIKLKGIKTNKLAIGSKVKVFVGKDTYTQEVNAGKGQLIQKSNRLHFGLGKNSVVDSVQVFWYGGGEETFKNIKVDGVNILTEGD